MYRNYPTEKKSMIKILAFFLVHDDNPLEINMLKMYMKYFR